ncbi:MAG: GNAT family N-acetyltransferase [Firmicutes bacterium]|nr:GNAT family N-acetyltransferase [[Eubacterium] siraeum]MCM1488550.1 GNAT family N-acetyltransferase [Bacillota bacterium]
MNDMILIRPEEKYADDIKAYRQELLDSGSSMDGCGPLRRMEEPAEWIEYSLLGEKKESCPEHLVPSTQFLYVRKTDDKIVGMIQVRHYFNEYLEKYAGHIGYSVRPSERRKGYAREMLKAALPYCKQLGIDKVMLACVDSNEASRRTILSNGGVYEKTVYEPKNSVNLEQYLIKL